MIRRLTVTALLALALVAVGSAPAPAKVPLQVEIHDERTGRTTFVDGLRDGLQPVQALEELIGWPAETAVPAAVRNDRATLVATLTWRWDESTPAWVDAVYADPAGRTWVERRDRSMGQETVTWGRVTAGNALVMLLKEYGGPATPPDTRTSRVEQPARNVVPGGTGAEPDAWDRASFGWGAGAGLLATGLVVAVLRLRQRSVTASRNSRVSAPASS